MKLLYIAFAGSDQAGVHRKLGEQVNAMRTAGATVETLMFVDTRVAPAPRNAPYRIVDVAGGGFGIPSRALAFHACWEAVDQLQPDLVYMRYPMYDPHVLRFVREAPPTVFELQTIFANEVSPELATFEDTWAARVLPEAAGLVGVTPEILEYEQQRAGRSIPGHVMANGADARTISFTPPNLAADRVDVLCVASFHPWHGLDRLIVGMAAEPDISDVHLHLVGDGPAIPALKTLAGEAGLAHRVHFHGQCPVDELDAMCARAHVAVGSLAPHRVGLTQLASLKHREYALRGMPMVLGGGDVDFPDTLPWMRAFPADDSPVSPRTLRALANAWSNPARRRQIRAWAESTLTWDAKMPTLLDFLETVR